MSIRSYRDEPSRLGYAIEFLKPKLITFGIHLTVVIVVGYIFLKNLWLIPVLAMLSGMIKPFLSKSSNDTFF